MQFLSRPAIGIALCVGGFAFSGQHDWPDRYFVPVRQRVYLDGMGLLDRQTEATSR